MLIAKQPEERYKVDPVSPGMHAARCYAVIDLGNQYSEMWKKEQHRILIIWETDEMMITAEGEEKPKAISKEFVLSLHEKADLYKTLISWRGKQFSPEELQGFDMRNILGAPCLLNIVENKKDDRVYSNIGGITPMMKGQTPPPPVNEKVFFELSAETLGEIDNLPKWISDKIKNSITYKELTEPTERAEKKSIPQLEPLTEEELDDLPF